MTSRQRLTRLFNRQEIDRIPIWLLAPYHRLGCYADIYNLPSYKKIIEYIDKYCDTFDRRGYNFGFLRNANPDVTTRRYETKSNMYTEVGMEFIYKDLVLKSGMITDNGQQRKKFLIDDIDDLMKLLEIPYIPCNPDLSSYLPEKEQLGDKGLMMSDIGDPLGVLYGLMDISDFCIFTVTEYEKLLEFTDEMYRRVLENYRYLLDRDIGDVFFIVGAEFAGPPIVSPSKFNELSVQYVKGIVDLIKEYGKKSIVHYHGNLFHVLDGMKQINPDGLHTIEAPPIGDCTITQAREKLGKDMILIGNIQYDDFRSLTPRQMEEAVFNVIEEGKSGGFILSPTAGPYESVLSEHMIENYIAFIEAGIKYGKM